MPEVTSGLRVLAANRPFETYFLALLLSSTGSVVAPVALAFAVLDATGSAGALGAVLAAQVVPKVALLLIGGVVADRWPRATVMVVANLVAFAAQAGVAAVLFADHVSLPLVMALSAVNGTATAFYRPSADSILPQLVEPAQLARANAVLRLSLNGSRLVGPAVGGVLVAVVGARYLIAWDALTFLAAALLLRTVRVALPSKVRPGLLVALRHGWAQFTARRWLWTCTLQMAVGGMAWVGGFQLLGPVLARRSHGGAAFWGLVVSAYALGLLLGGVLLLAWRPRRLLVAANLWSLPLVLPLLGLALHWSVPLTLAATVVAGAGTEVATIMWTTAKQRYVPVEELGRISSYDQVGGVALAPLAYPLAGYLATRFGATPVVLVSAVVLAGTSLLILLVREVRRLGTDEAQELREELEPVPT